MPVVKNKPKTQKVEETKIETIKPKAQSNTAGAIKPSATVQNLIASLNKKFGVNAVNIGVPKTKEGKVVEIGRIPTGSLTLDIALGGGIPVGRYTEISGDLSSTKTTQALFIIACAQKMGMVCAFFDLEGTTDEKYMRACGVDPSCVIYSNPSGMEEATEALLTLQKSGEVHLGILDSIAALIPNKELTSAMDETVRMGIKPQMLGEFFNKFQANNNKLVREGNEPFTLIGLNQLREKIGAYGDPEYSPGGKAKGFTASIDLRLRRGDWISEGKGDSKEIVGQVVKFVVKKNKTSKRMQTGEFDFYFENNSAGVPKNRNDNATETIILAVKWGIITRSGGWYYYDDKKYQGEGALTSALAINPELVDKLGKEITEMSKKEVV